MPARALLRSLRQALACLLSGLPMGIAAALLAAHLPVDVSTDDPAATTPAPDSKSGASVRTGKQRHRDGPNLGSVVVTARHRDEALRDVPMAITVLDADELARRGAEDLAALTAAAPNVVVSPARTFNNANTAYIRGIGQSETVWGVEPGVCVYIDDVYLARPQTALLDVLDVERIEVLR